MTPARWTLVALIALSLLVAGYLYQHRGPLPFAPPLHEVVVVGGGGVVGFSVEVDASGRLRQIGDRPSRVIRGPSTGLRNPIDVMIDSGGSIYVVNAGDQINPATALDPRAPPFLNPSITVYALDADGDAVPVRTLSPVGNRPDRNLVTPTGIVWRTIPDSLFVTDAGAHAIRQFLRDPVDLPVKQIAGDRTGLASPSGLAIGLDQGGAGHELYVVEPRQGEILVFRDVQGVADANIAPVRTITGLARPTRVAVDERANLYVVDLGHPNLERDAAIHIFAAGAAGAATPVRTLRTRSDGRGLSQPFGIAVAWDSLFVTDGNALKVFAPGAQGNERAWAIIEQEELGGPIAVAVRTRAPG